MTSRVRRLVGLGLAIALSSTVLGCGRRRTTPYVAPQLATTVRSTGLDVGLARFDAPVYFAPRDSRTTTEHGITTTTSTWEVSSTSVNMYVASLTRSVPFAGSRDQLLLDVLGDRIRRGALGEVTFEFQNGLLIASAASGDAHVRAYLSRTRLVLVVCTGQAPTVRSTMAAIVPTPSPDELFFLPDTAASDDAPRTVWGIGFSCTMPGGITHSESAASWRYASDDPTRHYEVVRFVGDHTVEELSADALARGNVLETADDFAGGERRRRVMTEVGGSWHAWQVTAGFTFHVSGAGPLTPDARARALSFFDGCVF
ncbi:MAG: hypothetical protein U0234_23840 [Sandaracinus sp.]